MRTSLFGLLTFIFLVVSCGTAAVTSMGSGDTYQHNSPTPGTLTAIGDAGSQNVFTFKEWHFASFDIPNGDPTQIKAMVDINVASVVCDWKELEQSVKKKPDYFNVGKFPKASVTIDGATSNSDGSYTTNAMVNIKGFQQPVNLTFTISDDAPYSIQGSGTIMRSKFGFTGDGPKEEVPVAFEAVVR